MKTLALSLLALSTLAIANGHSQTATITNFSTGQFNTNNGWISGISIQGQNPADPVGSRWQGNDPLVGDLGETDFLTFVSGYTAGGSLSGNRSLVQGGLDSGSGILPGVVAPSVWRSFTPLLTGPSETVTFSTEWSLVGSLDGSFPDLDTFAFDLRTADNLSSLIRLELTPGVATIANAYTLQWFKDGAFEKDLIDLGYQSLYQLNVTLSGSTFDLEVAQINSVTRLVITNFVLVEGGALSDGLQASDFATVALDWELSSGNAEQPGSNYIIVNDIAVVSTVIPEPSTWAVGLLLLAAVGGKLYRRRTNLTRAVE